MMTLIRSNRIGLYAGMVCMLLVIGGVPLHAGATSCVSLPSGLVEMAAKWPGPGNASYFGITLRKVPSGYDVTNGTYLGWCMDVNNSIDDSGTRWYPVRLYCSYDASMPSYLQDTDWDMVNYLLNHKQGNRNDVQQAIWYFVNGGHKPTGPYGQAMVEEAKAQGEGYVPEPSRVMAVLCDAGEGVQQTFIEVEVPPQDEECGPCKGKVTQLTLRYGGATPAPVEVKQKKPEVTVFKGTVDSQGTFTVNGADEKGTLSTEIRVYVNGKEHTTIHTSCSQDIGPGLVRGDFEVVSGYSLEGGLLCPLEEPSGGDDWCADGDKPLVLQMRYTGEGCKATQHHQKSDKVSCDGDPMFAPTVVILAMDKENPQDSKAKVWFDGIVALNGTFAMDARNAGEDKLKTETYVYVFGPSGKLLQKVKFHTSCSQPLVEGDQFGSLRLMNFVASVGKSADLAARVPEAFALSQNRPNPFNATTAIQFQIPEARHVVVEVFNISGQNIRTVAEGVYEAGDHVVYWDGTDRDGREVSSGVYVYRLQAGTFTQMRRMSLLR